MTGIDTPKDTPQKSVGKSYEKSIEKLNEERPKPKLVPTLTPEGTVVKEVHTQDATQKNSDIDRRVRAIQEQRQQAREKIKADFDRSR